MNSHESVAAFPGALRANTTLRTLQFESTQWQIHEVQAYVSAIRFGNKTLEKFSLTPEDRLGREQAVGGAATPGSLLDSESKVQHGDGWVPEAVVERIASNCTLSSGGTTTRRGIGQTRVGRPCDHPQVALFVSVRQRRAWHTVGLHTQVSLLDRSSINDQATLEGSQSVLKDDVA